MLKNYLKIVLRNMLKNKAYSIITVAGLAVGIATCLLILLFVQDELSYDRFHEKGERIYRVIAEEAEDGTATKVANTYAPLAPILQAANPEIEKSVRFFPYNAVVQYGEEIKFQEERFFFCDSTVFDMFSFAFLQGDPATALAAPNTVVLTQSTAQRFFGNADPLGKVLRIENQLDLTVTGVVAEVRHNAHFSFDMLASIQSVDTIVGDWVLVRGWHWPPMYTYLLLENAAAREAVESRFAEMIRQKLPESMQGWWSLSLQPLHDIHLNASLQNEIDPARIGNTNYIYIFSMVALFVLVIACINFMNLATARSTRRAREVGMRKVVGASRRQLVKQFLGESLVFATIAMLVSIAIVEYFLPTFNRLTGKQLSLAFSENLLIWAGLLGLTLFVGVVAGSYPAFFLTRIRTIRVLQGKAVLSDTGKRPVQLRSVLVVVQFVISVALIIITAGIHKQLDFMQNNRLGFDKEHIVVIPIRDDEVQNNFEALKNRMLANSGVLSATAISNFPWMQGFYGFPVQAEGMPADATTNIGTLIVDSDFTDTFGIELTEGRGFSKTMTSDAGRAFLLNESAKNRLGWQSAIDKRFTVSSVASGNDVAGRVIGVMKDFHMRSLHHEIEPLVVLVAPVAYYLDNLAVRISGQDVRAELAALQQTWNAFVPHRPFDYFFLDDAFDKLYRSEQRLGQIFNYFAGLTIFVGCLGLFGLASFTAEQRTKEIGIRKTLGATVSGIVLLLSKDFTRLIALAFVIAAPVAYYIVRQWLENFAYKTGPTVWTFLLTAALVFGIALLTVAYQSLKAALTDPVLALKHE